MKGTTSLAERIQIVEMMESGLKTREIGQRLGLSVSVVRKWRSRYRRAGRAGLASRMGRPVRGALSSYPAEARATLSRWRQTHPGWGPKTLRAEMARHPVFVGQAIPGQASIGRYLREQGLTRRYERHHALPQPKDQAVERVHQRWEMDARGYSYVPEVGVMSLININDCLSHARLVSYPCWLGKTRCQRHPDTNDYQTVMRLGFTGWGLPEQCQLDHDPIFHDHSSRSPFPTRLHLWLMALGVEVVFIGDSRPTDQGMTERSHQLWAAQCLHGQVYPDWNSLYHALQRRRDFLNYHLPCASLDNQPPLLAFPQAAHSSRPYRPEHEAELLDLNRVWNYLAKGRWFRLSSQAFTFCLGGEVYYLGRPWQHTQLDITFDPTTLCLVCRDPAGSVIAQPPIKGISLASLMGDLPPYSRLPFFQLALPFEWQTQKLLRLYETSDTRLIEV